MSTEQPVHELVDFVALAAVLTNEQKILATLERIEALLKVRFVVEGSKIKVVDAETPEEHSAKIAALQARVPSGRRK